MVKTMIPRHDQSYSERFSVQNSRLWCMSLMRKWACYNVFLAREISSRMACRIRCWMAGAGPSLLLGRKSLSWSDSFWWCGGQLLLSTRHFLFSPWCCQWGYTGRCTCRRRRVSWSQFWRDTVLFDIGAGQNLSEGSSEEPLTANSVHCCPVDANIGVSFILMISESHYKLPRCADLYPQVLSDNDQGYDGHVLSKLPTPGGCWALVELCVVPGILFSAE